MGALGWVLIGCLGLAILAGVVFVAGGVFVAKKVKDVAQDFEKNPAKAAAETMVRLNPDLELVESDDESETLTIRNKETGEEFTADWSDIQEGKISFESGDQQVTFDAQGSTGGGGMVRMTDESGEETMVLGGDAGAVPAWFPTYPGASAPGSTYSARNAGQETGLFTFTTTDSVDDAMAYYRDELGGLGFELSENTYNTAGIRGGSLSGEDGEGRTVAVSFNEQDGTTQVGVNYTVSIE
jgi:hypothetical protein